MLKRSNEHRSSDEKLAFPETFRKTEEGREEGRKRTEKLNITDALETIEQQEYSREEGSYAKFGKFIFEPRLRVS